MRYKYLALSLLGLLGAAPVFAEVITFSPTKNVAATLVLEGPMLTVTVKNEAHNDSRTIDFQAENDLHMQINDFNFDGVKDFAVSQIDDGMGTFDYYRIFIYHQKSSTFEELQPDCGDGFVNLRIESKRKALISTYWEINVPKQCVTRF